MQKLKKISIQDAQSVGCRVPAKVLGFKPTSLRELGRSWVNPELSDQPV